MYPVLVLVGCSSCHCGGQNNLGTDDDHIRSVDFFFLSKIEILMANVAESCTEHPEYIPPVAAEMYLVVLLQMRHEGPERVD